MSPRKYLLWTLAGFGLLTVVFWFSTAVLAQDLAADTPIIVKNGSIEIQSEGVDLATWTSVDNKTRHHPDQGKALGVIEVTGGQNATCSDRGRCLIVAKWSSGHTVRIVARAAGSRGLRLESSVKFSDSKWDKTTPAWKFPLPANTTLTVTITDQDTGGSPQTLCSGATCGVRVHYQ